MITLIWNPPATWHISVKGSWRTAHCDRMMPKRPDKKKIPESRIKNYHICRDCIRKMQEVPA